MADEVTGTPQPSNEQTGAAQPASPASSPQDALFKELSEGQARRDIVTDDVLGGAGGTGANAGDAGGGGGGGGVGGGGLTSRMESSRKKSDLEITSDRLNPDLGLTHLNVIENSRIFPDVYNPFFWIYVKDAIRRHNKRLAEALSYVNTALSIGIDGEGRIDNIQLMGKASDVQLEKAKINSMPGL